LRERAQVPSHVAHNGADQRLAVAEDERPRHLQAKLHLRAVARERTTAETVLRTRESGRGRNREIAASIVDCVGNRPQRAEVRRVHRWNSALAHRPTPIAERAAYQHPQVRPHLRPPRITLEDVLPDAHTADSPARLDHHFEALPRRARVHRNALHHLLLRKRRTVGARQTEKGDHRTEWRWRCDRRRYRGQISGGQLTVSIGIQRQTRPRRLSEEELRSKSDIVGSQQVIAVRIARALGAHACGHNRREEQSNCYQLSDEPHLLRSTQPPLPNVLHDAPQREQATFPFRQRQRTFRRNATPTRKSSRPMGVQERPGSEK
jgi:hypothetical protein